MSELKWTKADEKRASQLGFSLWRLEDSDYLHVIRKDDTFKTDREAAEWVIDCAHHLMTSAQAKTCRKAVMLCLIGGPQ